MTDLRQFMFDKLYTNPAAKSEEVKVCKLITELYNYYIDNIEIIAFTAAVFCAMPLFKGMLDIKYKHKVLRTLVNVWLILLFVLSSAEIAASTYNPFIYFRF